MIRKPSVCWPHEYFVEKYDRELPVRYPDIYIYIYIYIYICMVKLIGLGVACWPLVPKFAGSNPAEAVGSLRTKKSSARLPSEGK